MATKMASPRHPIHCKAIRQQILQYIPNFSFKCGYLVTYCTVVLPPDDPTIITWPEPTSLATASISRDLGFPSKNMENRALMNKNMIYSY